MNNNKFIFSEDDIESLRSEYKATLDNTEILRKIVNKIFNNYNILTLSQLDDEDDGNEIKSAIRSIFMKTQSVVITKNVTRNVREIVHHKGDFILDGNGNKITTEKGYLCYDRNVEERNTIETSVPFYDFTNKAYDLKIITDYINNFCATPDLADLREEMTSNVDYERGIALINEIQKYYVFEDPEKFAERFAMLICNAKSKALGIQPEYPVMFSIVGEQALGKGFFANTMIKTHDKIFKTRSSKTSFRRLFGRFNSVLATRGFVHFDEKNGCDSSQAEELKTIVTEEKIMIEAKHKDTVTIRNYTTLFSTTNESIIGMMGLQQNRRIVEFKLIGRNERIEADKFEELFEEIWKVMPVHFKDGRKIVNELLSDSGEMLDSRMTEIAGILLFEHGDEFVNGRVFKRQCFQNTVSNVFPKVSHAKIFSWLESKEILIWQKTNRAYFVSKKKLDKFRIEYDKQNNTVIDDDDDIVEDLP